jgi:hypothetical protein
MVAAGTLDAGAVVTGDNVMGAIVTGAGVLAEQYSARAGAKSFCTIE